ncbi:hypothetical protein GLOIN_2v1427013 [Rhizophagus irregularis DAOM 181602=DAOM 197198]|nr:hypothetical protein GLOIN_2v1427013 [Rhizophagus irregularis DAOM 181602=DAOM 197198]
MKGAFNDKPIFAGLCHVMIQAYLRKEKSSGRQNLKYSEEFTSFLTTKRNENDYLTDPDLCYENVARFK